MTPFIEAPCTAVTWFIVKHHFNEKHKPKGYIKQIQCQDRWGYSKGSCANENGCNWYITQTGGAEWDWCIWLRPGPYTDKTKIGLQIRVIMFWKMDATFPRLFITCCVYRKKMCILWKLIYYLPQKETEISLFDMWFNIVKPMFLFKTVDLWPYINA